MRMWNLQQCRYMFRHFYTESSRIYLPLDSSLDRIEQTDCKFDMRDAQKLLTKLCWTISSWARDFYRVMVDQGAAQVN